MSLKYALVFLVLAAGCAATAALRFDAMGWLGCAGLGYAGLAYFIMAAAYAGAGPGLLFKRADGSRGWAGTVLLWPYVLLNALTFRLYRLASAGPAYARIAPGVYLGRRLLPCECAAEPWVAVVDVAAEFAEVQPLRALPGYKSLPTLDATAPTPSQLREAVAWIAQHASRGPVYIHCALGHSRSACVALAYLLAIGAAPTLAQALSALQASRPGVGLNPAQWRRMLEYAEHS